MSSSSSRRPADAVCGERPAADVWDALAAGGYGPRGAPDDFRARCSGHDGITRVAARIEGRRGGDAALLRPRLLEGTTRRADRV